MTPNQLRMARAAIKIGVRELAEASGVAPATITRFETERGGINMKSEGALRTTLISMGVQFIPENGGGAGVRMMKTQP